MKKNFALAGAGLMIFGVLFFTSAGFVSLSYGAEVDCPAGIPIILEDGTPKCGKKGDRPTFQNIGGYVGAVAAEGFGGIDKIKNQNLATLIGGIIKGALILVGSIFLIMMVYGGYHWLMSHGDSEMVKKGRETVTNAIIGFIIVAAAYIITNFVSTLLSKAVVGV